MRHFHVLGFSLLGTLLFPGATYASLQIVPGATWTASNGEHLNAHGAGVIRVNGTFYLIGEDKSDGSAFKNVNCYSSRDLVQWTYEGALLSRTGSGDLGPNRIIERPKVIYNDKTGKYVMWMHVDSSDYGEAKVGVAVGDTVCGAYKYQRSFQPLGFESRDMNLFKDDDGTAYLLTEDRKNGLRIDKLTADYLDVAEATYLWKDHIEAPAMIKLNGRYYMFGSHLTGWDPNDNVYSTSTSLTSGWSAWATFADKGSNTYDSQTNYILNFGSADSPANIMYMGDRWVSKNLQSSTYVWLPLTISGTTVTLKNRASWVPNVNPSSTSSTWSAAPAQTSYDPTASGVGTYANSARTVSCSACAGGSAAGYLGGSADGQVRVAGVRSDADVVSTVQLRYANGDSTPRYAGVAVNGGQKIKVAFEPTAGKVATSVVHVPLRSGSGNEIVIGGVDGGWAPDVDWLVVPVS
ncbi:f29a3c22-3d62-4b6c-b927-9138dfeb6e83 [Thermothielavioides terrestris]|uniref:Glycoside hydrolase family 43 protein n=2 Tax=Thermothielavioides terrestris TaxID=2587410 RepID=G2R7Z2_THETT|nr:glycoside hydrolase family 43 protein [Thermothielavioides terrestris NRRL 8126]AEO68051.1 glycoside hydrolase family 43 protein [Thermothielavioides terrestris NRRL 8126]SPQ24707.1 f29a3c22-3d62-4b6c-b927-9138dfeb6e83 [Thermothielavioides terrestris]